MKPQRRTRRIIAATLAALLVGGATARADDETPIARTPPRLSLIQGEVSFWRPNGTDWAHAHLNTPLAPGDQLYSGTNSRLELQIGAHAFLRADGNTQLAFETQEPDFQQFDLVNGRVVVDLRQLDRGHAVEIDTPTAAFTLDRVGYYRIDVDKARTRFTTRRGGHASVTPAGGQPIDVEPNELTVIDGSETPHVVTSRAPDVDDSDRWNYDRTDHLLDASSDQYVPPEMYGTSDLDRYGDWRVVPTYGRVWAPAGVSPDWAPYSTGNWIQDPYYGWTWVDDAPWGWAPYHYGRWVYVDSYWAWAPGPIAVAVPPIYSPALVAFFAPPFGVGMGVDFPFVSWVALGWGEPLFPWWGPTFFIGRPWWGGWCGPHWHAHWDHGHVYHNFGVHNAVVTVRRERFHGSGFTHMNNARDLQVVHGALPRSSGLGRVEARGSAIRPPAVQANRSMVTARSAGVSPSSRFLRAGVPSSSFTSRGLPSSSNKFASMPAPPHGSYQFARPAAASAGRMVASVPRTFGGTFSAPSGPPHFTAPTRSAAPPRVQTAMRSSRSAPAYRSAPAQRFVGSASRFGAYGRGVAHGHAAGRGGR